MKIAIATDAWQPQVNGVVRTYENTVRELIELGHEVLLLTPENHRTIPCPTYPSIRMALFPGRSLARQLDEFRPDAIHVSTEGTIGHAARAYCRRRSLPFTSSLHTQFPEYVRMRIPIPVGWTYAYLRRFHGAACRTLVPTPSQCRRLVERGFENVVVWSRGVDTSVFKPNGNDFPPVEFIELPRPIFIYMGRIAVEKNIEAFLDLELPGSKIVVGDGPDLPRLRHRYPDVTFTGYKFGAELAAYLAAANVFVFPSKTDTYGMVILEAMACGLPVAAYPVTGPVDVVEDGRTGVLHEDLKTAALAALELDPAECIEYARKNSWRRCAESFAANLQPTIQSH